MKKVLIYGISILAGLTLAFKAGNYVTAKMFVDDTAEIKWVTLAEAQKLGDANPKRIFMDISTSWCGWCKTMDATTFKNPVIAKFMNDHFYCVHFDAETTDTVVFNGQKFWNRGAPNSRSANDFAITVLQGRLSYPSFAFISKDRLNFTIMQGYQTAQQFEPYIHYYGEDKDKTESYDDFLKTFKSELPATDATQPAQVPAPH
ncbi:MAG TPA: DUF255 domain-containing protein [Bacteroidia bacterium]|jgi:thioredoxin-related protein|nr:DUF255 domain-containing protein [Bacteroidia bacterium]